jgi:pumilio RNA-binding family
MQSQFIIDEISGSACSVARHRYGCRVLQRLFEHCPPAQLRGLLDELLGEAVDLCRHVYGSYVMKHFLEHGDEKDANALTWILAANVSTMQEHDYGFAVLGEALRQAGQDAKLALASVLLLQPDVLTNMAHSRHGNLTVKLVLQVAEGTLPTERQTAVSELMARRYVLEGSRYGKVVSKYLMQCSEQA